MQKLALVARVMLVFIVMLAPTLTFAEDPPVVSKLIISEIKIKNDSGGYNEFIELYNISENDIPLNDYNFEYFNVYNPAPEQLPVKTVIAEGLLPPGQRFVLGKESTVAIPNTGMLLLTSLADSGGLLKVVTLEGHMEDQIAWTSTARLAVAPVVHMPSSGSAKSLVRSVDELGVPIIEPALWILEDPSPKSAVLLPSPPTEEPDPEPTLPPDEEPVEEEPPVSGEEPEETLPTLPEAILSPMQINELFPDPAPPLTDAADEFVELYNPNNEPIELTGYKLQTGTNYSYSFVFTNEIIPPNGYFSLESADTGLVLANSAGRARLINPSGQVIAETTAYEDADEGSAWAFINGSWQWTKTPTPNSANILTVPVAPAAAVRAAAAKKTKTTAKKAVAKPKAKKASASKSKKTAAATTNSTNDNGPEETAQVASLHPAVLAGVGGLAVLYGAYEYRQNMANWFYRLQRYRANRRAARQEP